MSDRKRSKKIVVVDWDTRTLRMVHAFFGKRGPKIDRVLAVAIPKELDSTDPEQMGAHIRRALEQEGITTKNAIVDIPRDQATLNTLRLPAASPEDLPGMVEIQIAKELPFPVLDAVVDFAVPIDKAEGPTMDVPVSAVRREVLQRFEATIAAAGLKLDRVGLRPYAHKVALCDRLKHAMPELVVFIDVRPTLTEIDVLRGGALAFSRAASAAIPDMADMRGAKASASDSLDDDTGPRLTITPRGLASESEASVEACVQNLIIEVTRSIEAYRATDPGAQIDLIVIGGDAGIEQELADALQQQLGVSTELYNPASSFGWEPDEGASASAYAATLGLVLAQADDAAQHFDFLHPKKATSVAQERLRRAPLVAAVIALFVVAGWVVLTGLTSYDRENLVKIEKQIVELEGKVRENRKFLKYVDAIKEFDEQYVWVDVMQDIISVLPSHEEFVLHHLSVRQDGGQVVLKTQTKRREMASEVIRSLEAFRREWCDEPRFKATMPSQSEKPKDLYPFSQELRIVLLQDEVARKDPMRR